MVTPKYIAGWSQELWPSGLRVCSGCRLATDPQELLAELNTFVGLIGLIGTTRIPGTWQVAATPGQHPGAHWVSCALDSLEVYEVTLHVFLLSQGWDRVGRPAVGEWGKAVAHAPL